MPIPPRRGRTVSEWRRTGALLCAGTLLLQGCYQSLPVQTGAPPVAERVQFILNDQGRVNLAPKLGSAVERVEGTVVRVSEQGYEVSVISVTHMGGESAIWNGERVTVGKDFVSAYSIRRYHRTRTLLLAGGITVGILLFILGRSLLIGAGTEEPTPTPDPGPPSLIRLP